MNYSLLVMESTGMMKMATEEGFPPPAGCRNGSRLVFGGYGGFWQRNSQSRFLSGSFCIYKSFGIENKSGGLRAVHEAGGRALHPRGPLVAPLTYFFLLYIPIYPKTFGGQNRSGVPPPQASVATKTQSGPCSGTLPEGGSLTGGHLHHLGALHDEEGVVHPRG